MVEQNKVTRGNNNDNRWIQNGKKQSFTWYGLTLVTKKKISRDINQNQRIRIKISNPYGLQSFEIEWIIAGSCKTSLQKINWGNVKLWLFIQDWIA